MPIFRMGYIRREEGEGRLWALDQGWGRGEGTSSKSHMWGSGHVGLWTAACSVPHLSEHLLVNEMLSQAQESCGQGLYGAEG